MKEETVKVFTDLFAEGYLPPKAILYLGLICNLRCPYCYLPYKSTMPDEVKFDQLLEKLLSLDVKRLEVLGGEPFIYKNRLLLVLEQVKKRNIALAISTNGLIYDKEVVEKLRMSGIEKFQVSIDACTPATYMKVRGGTAENFDKVIKNIKRFQEDELDVILSFVLVKPNINELGAFVEMANRLNVRKLNIGTFTPVGEGKNVWNWMLTQEDFNSVSAQLEKLKVSYPNIDISFNGAEGGAGELCNAGTTEIAVLPNGDIYPCGLFVGLPSYKIGNLFTGLNATRLKSILVKETLLANSYKQRCVACKIATEVK
jgi:uncharacterized protein